MSKDKSDILQIGLTPNHLSQVFPYHIAINSFFEITQVGSKLSSFFPARDHQKNPMLSSLVGNHIGSCFTVSSPPHFKWNWNQIFLYKDLTWNFDLNEYTMLEEVRKTKKNINKLPLRGGLIVFDPITDSTVTELSAVFLVNLRLSSTEEMSVCGLHPNDLSKFSLQREHIITGENLRSHIMTTHRLESVAKLMRTGIETVEAQSMKTEQILETKRIFVRHISHEVRTPLNVVMLGLKLVEEKLTSSNDQESLELIREMSASCSVAVDTLNDLLLYEKIEGDMFSLDLEEVSIGNVIKETVRLFRIQANYAGVLLQWESGAKETLQGLKAQLDIAKFAQVLRNILSNALKFTPVGGNVTLSTELISNSVKSSSSDVTETETEESMGQFMRFSVEDSGVGISEEDQKSLFSEFKQINPAKLQNGGGSGLGLWVARNIIQAHGGSIGVYSAGEGLGSTFYIDIPISRIDYTAVENISLKSPYSNQYHTSSSSSSSSLMLSETDGNSESRKRIRDLENRAVQSDSISNKKHNTTNTPDFSLGSDQITRRLLLVDDSSMNRKMAMRVLQHNFSYIDQASDGREAIEMVNNLDPNLTYDVIMMDSEMPIMKGPDAVRELRKAGYTGLIIGVTGNSMESDIESFRSAGCDKVMIKPLDINAFLAFTVY